MDIKLFFGILSSIIAVICFVYLAIFAVIAKSVLKKQGIDIDTIEQK